MAKFRIPHASTFTTDEKFDIIGQATLLMKEGKRKSIQAAVNAVVRDKLEERRKAEEAAMNKRFANSKRNRARAARKNRGGVKMY